MKLYTTNVVEFAVTYTLIFKYLKLKMSLDILDVKYRNIGSVFIAHSSP